MFHFDDVTFRWFEAVLVFFSTLAADLLWVVYIRRTTEGKALQSAVFSGLIVFLGAFAVAGYVENSWYLFPAVLGAFIGTLFTVTFDKKKTDIKK